MANINFDKKLFQEAISKYIRQLSLRPIKTIEFIKPGGRLGRIKIIFSDGVIEERNLDQSVLLFMHMCLGRNVKPEFSNLSLKGRSLEEKVYLSKGKKWESQKLLGLRNRDVIKLYDWHGIFTD